MVKNNWRGAMIFPCYKCSSCKKKEIQKKETFSRVLEGTIERDERLKILFSFCMRNLGNVRMSFSSFLQQGHRKGKGNIAAQFMRKFYAFRRSRAPYNMKVGWDFPVGAGNIEIDISQISSNKVEGKVSLLLGKQQGTHTFYTVDLNLYSNSAQDLIDVGGSFELKSNHDYWE